MGRLGGDEFVAVCRHITTPAAATALAERLARSMHWVFQAGTSSFPVSASVGVVHCVDAESTAEVLARAERRDVSSQGVGRWRPRDVERVALRHRFGWFRACSIASAHRGGLIPELTPVGVVAQRAALSRQARPLWTVVSSLSSVVRDPQVQVRMYRRPKATQRTSSLHFPSRLAAS